MSAEELAKKKRVRAGHKASATRMIGSAEDLLKTAGSDTVRLTQLRRSLQEKLDVLKTLDGEILDLVDDGAVADEIEQADTFKEGIYSTMVKIENYCSPPIAPPTTTPSTSSTSATVTAGPSPSAAPRVRLPKLTIRPFNGDLTAWTTFWDSYESSIHKNPSLSDIDRFNYLRSLLEHTALDSISGLTLTSTNYHEAIEILKRRFGNKQQIISRHMDILLNIDAVTSQHNLKGLRHLYDLVESHVRSLKSLGVSPDAYGTLLSSVLLNKLPPEIRLIASRTVGEDSWSLDALLKVVEEELRARERSVANSSSQPKKTTSREQATAAALLSGSVNPGPTCSYCGQPHASRLCETVKLVEDRRRILQRAGRCFICLRRGHISRNCRTTSRCAICKGRHHVSICSRNAPSSETPPSSSGPATSQPRVEPTAGGLNPQAPVYAPTSPTTSLWIRTDQAILLQTAKAIAFNTRDPRVSHSVRIVLDTGSQRSYVTNAVKEKLSLVPEGEQCMSIMTFGSVEETPQRCKFVKVGLILRDGGSQQLTLFAVPTICEPLASQPIAFCQKNYEHLSGLDLADSSDGCSRLEVDILIGSDQYWNLITGKTRRGTTGPVAIDTKLGWVLSGPTSLPTREQPSSGLITHTLRVDALPQDDASLDQRLKSFWELESFGVPDSDISVYDNFRQTVQFRNGRYEVSLPWKDSHPNLPDNYQLSLNRLNGLLRRLRQDKQILCEYDSVIKTQIRQGIVEIVEHPERTDAEQIHYLPHHAVVRRDKDTTKLRIVYDASSKATGPSLNDCLHAGPKFDQHILDILLRFRIYRTAVAADIEKAFLMIAVTEKDRDVLRFLWKDDPSNPNAETVVLRFTRVVFGVSSSPFLLNATIRHHLEKHVTAQPDLVNKLKRSTYVDDIVTGAESEEAAYHLYKASKEILSKAGFNLRKFTSNSLPLRQMIEEEECHHADPTSIPADKAEETYAQATLGGSQRLLSGEQKILGVKWNTDTDQIVVSLNEIAQIARNLEPTKRNIVSLVGRFYDPLGILAPVVVKFKMFLQTVCEAKLEWDQPLPTELSVMWSKLSAGLLEAQTITIPRCCTEQPGEVKSYTLCRFCDASLGAYAAVVYLLMETETSYFVRFLAAKTRVSPLKKQTIPRLELLSSLLLSRLMVSISQSLEGELKLTPPCCFTDSKVALFWIQGVSKDWKPFVQNRVTEIRSSIPPDRWRHCSGRDNPADVPSRGCSPLELSVNTLWREGPDWLQEKQFHVSESEQTMPEDCVVEMKARDRPVVHGLLTTEDPSGLAQVMNCEDFSSLDRLLRTTALVLKFCHTLQCKTLTEVTDRHETDETARAEVLWIIESQISLLRHKNFDSWKKQFGLFLDNDGIWRCRGRIANADVPYSTKYPIMLHSNHHLTKLFVQSAHQRVCHNGVKETLTELRSRFWIVKGRSTVRQVIHRCTICKRLEGKPYLAPPPPPLPAYRVQEAPPFTVTGVDFAGPLYVRSSDGTQSKVWICLYTCCVVRAVHLDLVPDMSTPTFLRSFKRFAARRGLPSRMISDNGRTFKARRSKPFSTTMMSSDTFPDLA